MTSRFGVEVGAALLLAGALILSATGGPEALSAQEPGEELFRQNCAACHSLGTERVLGPGLAGIVDRREENWLIRKITEPEQLVAEDDPITQELVQEYGMAMVNLGITQDQAAVVLSYLATAAVTDEATPDAVEPERSFTEAEVRLGRALFQGEHRFENRGVGCNACHDVTAPNVIGGGNLAVSLGDSWERLGPTALESMVRNAPFPVMRRAYRDRPVTDEELHALLAFFQELDGEAAAEASAPYAPLLAGAGILGTLLLAGLFTLIWRGRRRGTVHREIFERQVKTR